jgi:hypothetical protein
MKDQTPEYNFQINNMQSHAFGGEAQAKKVHSSFQTHHVDQPPMLMVDFVV